MKTSTNTPSIKLGILDQSVVRNGATAEEALQETIETTRMAEKLGYSRLWISEHHNSTFIAGSTPEVLMARLAAETKHIRIGSGGIMLPNHSAFKMAENFRMLEALYPERIDMGMGRAPGGDRVSASLLNPSNRFSEEDYIKQLQHLGHFFRDEAATNQGPVYAIPQAKTVPQPWILSSSGGSAKIAAEMGMGLAVAKFINGNVSPEVVENYRKNFKPSADFNKPKVLLSSFVMCGETEEIATNMRKYMDYILLQFGRGKYQDHPPFETIKNYEFSLGEQEVLKAHAGRIISGTPDAVGEQLQKLASGFEVDEIIISTMGYTKELRLKSFELIADVMDLGKTKPQNKIET